MNLREEWIEALLRIVDPVFDSLSKNKLHENLEIEYSPLKRDHFNPKIVYLEAFARCLIGVSPWLSITMKDDESELRDMYRNKVLLCISNVFDLKNTIMDFTKEQSIVECAYIAQAFIKSKKTLWNPLSSTDKTNIINVFKKVLEINADLYQNNWILFKPMIEIFLYYVDFPNINFSRIHKALDKFEEWYLGDGWYKDGEKFHMDYYNSFVIHPMIIDIVTVLKYKPTTNSKKYIENYETYIKRLQRYCEYLERSISPDGAFPVYGRSMIYRFGCFQALSYCILLDKLPDSLTYESVKSALTCVMRRLFSQYQNFNEKEFLVLGFNGKQPEIADVYSNNGSAYLTTTAFLHLGLPKSHEFWNCNCTYWTQKNAWYNLEFKNDHYKNV